MRYTNLKLLQQVARALNSDEVDLVDETLESQDILGIMERTLDDILGRRHWEFMRDKLGVMTAGNSVIQTTLPIQLVRLQELQYRDTSIVEGKYTKLIYMESQDFIRRLQSNDKAASNTDEVDIGGVKVWPRNDVRPMFYTSLDELTILVDSYDISEDATGIDATKMSVLGILKPVFDFTITSGAITQAIPEQMFNYWLWETIAVASSELRQVSNQRAERSARRAYTRLLELEPTTRRDDGQDIDYGRTNPSRLRRTKRV